RDQLLHQVDALLDVRVRLVGEGRFAVLLELVVDVSRALDLGLVQPFPDAFLERFDRGFEQPHGCPLLRGRRVVLGGGAPAGLDREVEVTYLQGFWRARRSLRSPRSRGDRGRTFGGRCPVKSILRGDRAEAAVVNSHPRPPCTGARRSDASP